MFNKILNGRNSDEYVYIIEGCTTKFASSEPPSDKPCPLCGEFDWEVCQGLVKDIRRARRIEDLYRTNKANIETSKRKSLKL